MERMNKTIVLAVIISVGISFLSFLGYNYFTKEKIAFIRTGIFIQDYQGMRDANARLDVELKEYQSVMDSLQMRYKLYQEMKLSGTTSEKESAEKTLPVIEQQLKNFQENATIEIQKRKNDLTRDVLNEINIQISRYGEKHNYTLILGSTSEGSLLYGKEANDITEDLLKELNELYQKEKSANNVSVK